MKKIFLFLVLSPSFITKASDSLYSLLEAIDHSDLSDVESVIATKNSYTKIEKESLVKAASDAVTLRKRKLSIFRSGRDVLRALGGFSSICLSCGAAALGFAIAGGATPKKIKVPVALTSLGIGTAGSAFGVWQIFKGLNVHSAFKKLTAARTIENLINKLEVSDKIA